MIDLRKAAEMAIEALTLINLDVEQYKITLPSGRQHQLSKASFALRQALAQSEQEPVAWITDGGKGELGWRKTTEKDISLYTAPPKREWVGLTDEEIEEHFFNNVNTGSLLSFGAGAAYAEAKLKEKNSGSAD